MVEETGIYDIPAIFDELPHSKKRKLETEKKLKQKSTDLIFKHGATRNCFSEFRKIIKSLGFKFPAYNTVSSWVSKICIPWNEEPNTILNMLESDCMLLISCTETEGKKYFYISISNRFIWIFHNTTILLKELNLFLHNERC